MYIYALYSTLIVTRVRVAPFQIVTVSDNRGHATATEKPYFAPSKCHNRAKRSHEALCVTVVDDSRLLDV